MSDRTGNSLSSGGDVELCYLLQLAGYEIWFDQGLKFFHWMPNSRINWSYYLKLKKGIVSGSARLFSYSCLLRQPTITRRKFRLLFCFRVLKITAVYCKFKLIHLFRIKDKKEEVVLTELLLSNRLKAFYYDRKLAINHFEHIKSFL